jgi:electron transport complex protein RnfB
MSSNLVDQINNLLPQTQCTRCGYPSCKDYAVAIANNTANINQCPPGGNIGIEKLANLLDRPIIPLNPVHGTIDSKQNAFIDESSCIGCAICIKACPVDAILGSNKMLHTVIADECTGCELCVPVCPVDCITMIDDINPLWNDDRAQHAKQRFEQRNIRIKQEKLDRELRLAKYSSKP